MILLRKIDITKLKAQSFVLNKTILRPVVKLFHASSCTWLLSELADDNDTLFGLCDLGAGTPELGNVSLKDLSALRDRFGLSVERDKYFEADATLAEYAHGARVAGRIVA